MRKRTARIWSRRCDIRSALPYAATVAEAPFHEEPMSGSVAHAARLRTGSRQHALPFAVNRTIQHLLTSGAEHAACIALTGVTTTLLRQQAEV